MLATDLTEIRREEKAVDEPTNTRPGHCLATTLNRPLWPKISLLVDWCAHTNGENDGPHGLFVFPSFSGREQAHFPFPGGVSYRTETNFPATWLD
jgi:hypothetical protein